MAWSLTHPPPPGQNDRHFADDIFRCIFVNEKICILIKITLKGPIANNPELVKIMAWHRIGPIDWRIYAALVEDELMLIPQNKNKFPQCSCTVPLAIEVDNDRVD